MLLQWAVVSRTYTRLLSGYYTRRERAARKWVHDNGNDTLRYQYDIKPNDCIFDIGGYMGDWTAGMTERYDCSSYIFEPVSSFSNHIKTRFLANPKVQVFQFGLEKENRNLFINIADDASSCFSHNTPDKQEMIQYIAVDDFFSSHQIEQPIKVIKINIEGGEYDLLEALLDRGIISEIANLQIQFHHIPHIHSLKRMRKIQRKLKKTHVLQWSYRPYVWESWTLMDH